MRWLNGAMCLILILFAAVQYNDPDWAFWGAIYGLAALWAGLAAFQPGLMRGSLLRAAFLICAAAAIWGMVHFWPETDGWWRQEVWWKTEAAREGMGMMIVVAGLSTAGAGAFFRRSARAGD